uniref:Kexin ) n=1 Tax=Ganoderma boninense TaxID=34458 RepID=A0A5K1K678_9APHY|nr:Kexin (EC (KEX2 protease) [Ganoderma boninense]
MSGHSLPGCSTKTETTSTLSANGGHETPEKIPPWRDLQRKGAFITPDDPETKRKTRDKMRFKVRRAQKRWREKQAKDTQSESKDDDSEADADAVASMLLGSPNDI